MSLQSDLARNRKIFERLTTNAGQSDENAQPRRNFEALSFDEVRTRTREKVFEQDPPKPVESYSLEYGERRQTGMALDFKAPGDIEYPKPDEAKPAAAYDPLESFYYQLETEARMSSQLLQEEEF